MTNFCARYFTNAIEAEEIFNKLDQIDENSQFSFSIFQQGEEDEWCVEILFYGFSETFNISSAKLLIQGIVQLENFHIEELPDEDWVAKSLKALQPIHVGRFFIHGSHDRDVIPGGVIPIEIEATQAFGTGHHETTFGCLIELSRLLNLRKFYSALDVGTGTGLLSIAIARTAYIPVVATDIDPIAVKIARENIKINQVTGFVKVLCANGINHPAVTGKGQFDLIVANILANPLIEMVVEISSQLVNYGILVLSGLQIQDEPKVRARYSAHGFVMIYRKLHNNWVVLTLEKRTGKLG